MAQRSEAEYRREVGERLRAARTQRRLKIHDLEGLDSGQVSRFEHGHRLPDAVTLTKLSTALRVSVDWILTGQTFGSPDPIELPAPRVRGLEIALSGFLHFVEDTRLGRWAATAPKDEAPTVGEAIEAICDLEANPTLIAKRGGWGPVIREVRRKMRVSRFGFPIIVDGETRGVPLQTAVDAEGGEEPLEGSAPKTDELARGRANTALGSGEQATAEPPAKSVQTAKGRRKVE